jgi:hypothetical protein
MTVCKIVKNGRGEYVFTLKSRIIGVIWQFGRTHSAHNGRKMHQTKNQRMLMEIIAKLVSRDIRVVEPGLGVGSEYLTVQNILSDCYPK